MAAITPRWSSGDRGGALRRQGQHIPTAAANSHLYRRGHALVLPAPREHVARLVPLSKQSDPAAPKRCGSLDLTGTTLAGVGAVGSTWVYALWATPELHGTVALVDDDHEGVTTTNL